MAKRLSGAAALAMVVVLALSGCGSTSRPAASISGGSSPTPAASAPVASPPSSGVLVVTQRPMNDDHDMTIQLIDLDKRQVVLRRAVTIPGSPRLGACAAVVPPPVRVAAGAVYYADTGGVIRRVDRDGSVTQVATFALTSPQQLLSYAVSPDGQKLIAIIVSTPPLKNPVPPPPYDPFVAGGHWTLDLETAIPGGPATLVLHKDLGVLGTAGPTLIAGWDDQGPTATLNSYVCVQNPVPSVEYAGTQLIHLGLDGSHLDVIGGPACAPWDELHDGTVLCGGKTWQTFDVRTSAGQVLWSRSTSGGWTEPKLSPDGRSVSVNGQSGAIFTLDGPTVASFGRVGPNGPTVAMLGWADRSFALVAKLDQGGRLGLVPAVNATNFIDLGVSVGEVCFDCLPVGLALVGTIGLAA